MNTQDREIEVKFLEINTVQIKEKLVAVGAEDRGEDLLKEVIFYDQALLWSKQNKFVRIRSTKRGNRLTYKHDQEATVAGTIELEFGIDDPVLAEKFLESIGLVAFRHQEKKRHSWRLGDVSVELDTWPKIPTYLELEGQKEQSLHEAAHMLGLDWTHAIFGTAPRVIEGIYKIPVKQLKYFTFNRIE